MCKNKSTTVFSPSLADDRIQHYRITYIDISFQQTRVSRSVKTGTQFFLVINCKLHKFATANSNFEKNLLFQTCIIVKRTCKSVKSVHTKIFCKYRKLHKFAMCNEKFEKITPFGPALLYNRHSSQI